MTQINTTGAIVNFTAVSGGDIVRTYNVTAAGVARDLSNATIEIVVKDIQDNCSPKIIGTYSQTITDAVNGAFTFKIPYAAMNNLDGEEMSYRLYITENGDRICHQSGIITISEIV